MTVVQLMKLLLGCYRQAEVSVLVNYDGEPVHVRITGVDANVSNYVVLKTADRLVVDRVPNDPARRGRLAAPKRLFGAHNRYAVAPVYTRGNAVEWFVWDASIEDPITGPAIIRQAPSEAEAIAGLE